MFHVGQKVVCVDATPNPGWSVGTLQKGAVYTIRWIGFYAHPLHHGIHVRLQEIIRPCGDDSGKKDTPYRVGRFRPLDERKTDISIFTAMLDDVKSKEPTH
jgi:hypothetical protein